MTPEISIYTHTFETMFRSTEPAFFLTVSSNEPAKDRVLKEESDFVNDLIKDVPPQETATFFEHRTTFWADNTQFFNELEFSVAQVNQIISKIIRSAITRKIKGGTALGDQSTAEHLAHMNQHLELWMKNDPGDECSVEEQAKHFVCRAILAYCSYLYLERTTSVTKITSAS